MSEPRMRDDGRDEWATPDDVFDRICKYWGILPFIDVAASESNTKCKYFITKEMDALKVDWLQMARELGVEPWFWVQPPYTRSIMIPFIQVMDDVCKREPAARCLFLLPAFVDQGWYHDYIDEQPHKFWRGRIRHIPPPGVEPSQPRYGSVHGCYQWGGVA